MKITQKNIGKIRRFFFVPWNSKWNAFVRDITAKYEKPIKKQITMHFGGGCLFLKCHQCNKDVGAEEVDFPGTSEQQKIPREKLVEWEKKHLLICT